MAIIPYGTLYTSKEEPSHEIGVYMCYVFHDMPHYFTISLDSSRTARVLSEYCIEQWYKPKIALKEKRR